ncbi:MAG: hypothetical protein U1E05_09560 [Patescibacteria group bacterium]|nr:hypothetical protein [Patescibacteria group bacterium]
MNRFEYCGPVRAWIGFTTLALAIVVGGCGGGDSGPARYELSGTVTFDGQPVPYGNITITPDTSQGNTGPGSFAQIRDGRYQTASDAGTVGGPHVLTVTGLKAVPGSEGVDPADIMLFDSFEVVIDLPKEDKPLDIAVPATAAAR